MAPLKNWDNKTWLSSHKYIHSINNFLLNQVKLNKKSRILDMGCGRGKILANLSERLHLLNKPIGILGGSFDPAHKGHLIISKLAIKKLKLNKVLWLVTKQNPFKERTFYSLPQRIVKAKKISKNIKKIQVIHLEKTIHSSRSINAINYLITKKKLKNIYFIIGSDNLIKFHEWKSWKKIVKLTKLIVFSRRGYDNKSKKSIVAKYLKNKITFVNNKPIIISSTNLRSQILKNY